MRLLAIVMFCTLTPNLYCRELPDSAVPPKAPYVEREEKQFNFFPGGKIEIVAGAAGNVTIVGWEKGSIRMEAEKIVYYLQPEQAKIVLREHPIRVRWNQTSAAIQTSVSPASESAVEVNLTVYVPKQKTDINAKISLGDFSVDSVNGWIETTMLQGSVRAKSLSGYFSAITQRGDIDADMSGIRWRGLEFDAVTRMGSVNLLLPSNYSAALQLETRDGRISVDYPPQVVDGEPTPPDIEIRKNSQSMKASVGDGGAPIRLVTYSGNVNLTKKPE